jgi:hypothetical protein
MFDDTFVPEGQLAKALAFAPSFPRSTGTLPQLYATIDPCVCARNRQTLACISWFWLAIQNKLGNPKSKPQKSHEESV